MKIETKFNVGDTVYTIDKKTMKLKEFEISSVTVLAITKDTCQISYGVKTENYNTESYEERVCFASRDDLLDYVTSVIN